MHDGLHERFDREKEGLPSERSLGLLFAGFCALIAAIKLWKGSNFSTPWFGAAVVLVAIALARPIVLRPLNQLWMRLAELLYRILNPVVMTLLFFAVFVPTGLLLRALGKDVLRLKVDKDRASYWIDRNPPGPDPGSMTNQF
jgi:hypothetical protein